MENNPLERPNYYAILPASVRYSDVSANAKLLYAEITALCNKTGTCWAGNKYFAELYGVDVRSITNWITQLVDAGFIDTKVVKSQGNKRYLSITDVPIENNFHSSGKKVPDINNKTNTKHYVEMKKALLSLVNKATGRQFRTLPEKGVKKTLDAFTLEEIHTALTALARDPWHQPKLKELSIDYFIRSTTIDRFMGKAPAPGEAQPTWTEDDDGNRYYKGELLTPQNQERIMKENQKERDGSK